MTTIQQQKNKIRDLLLQVKHHTEESRRLTEKALQLSMDVPTFCQDGLSSVNCALVEAECEIHTVIEEVSQ